MKHFIPLAAIVCLLAACQSTSKHKQMTVAQLVVELKSPDANVRLSACNELGTRNGIDAVNAVESLQDLADNDPDPKVQKAASEAIPKIMGNETD
jgi:S-adenosylhomocysteine hydrolase